MRKDGEEEGEEESREALLTKISRLGLNSLISLFDSTTNA